MANSVQDCLKVLCSSLVGSVAPDDWVAVAEHAVSVTQEEIEKTGVNGRPEKAGDGWRWLKR